MIIVIECENISRAMGGEKPDKLSRIINSIIVDCHFMFSGLKSCVIVLLNYLYN